MLVAGCRSAIVCKLPVELLEVTVPTSVPDRSDARANAGNTTPMTKSIEMNETTAVTAFLTLALLLRFFEPFDPDV